jgi:hypothetical protein
MSHALLAFLLTTLSTGELSAELLVSLIGLRAGGDFNLGEGAGAKNSSSEGKLCFLAGLPLFLGDGVCLLEVLRAAEDTVESLVVVLDDTLLPGVPTALLPALLRVVDDLADLPLNLFLYILQRGQFL